MKKPLILAIEPSKPQAQQVVSLVRDHVQAELVTAASAEAAFAALGDRIPDLVLTPVLLAPQDESALAERLRELGAAASHVQTLAVPILASAQPRRASGGGLLGLRRERSDADGVGCEPAVFAEQIAIYLQRAAELRASVRGAAPADPAPSRPVSQHEADTRTLEAELGLASAVRTAPPLWQVAESVGELKEARTAGFVDAGQPAPEPDRGLLAPEPPGPVPPPPREPFESETRGDDPIFVLDDDTRELLITDVSMLLPEDPEARPAPSTDTLPDSPLASPTAGTGPGPATGPVEPGAQPSRASDSVTAPLAATGPDASAPGLPVVGSPPVMHSPDDVGGGRRAIPLPPAIRTDSAVGEPDTAGARPAAEPAATPLAAAAPAGLGPEPRAAASRPRKPAPALDDWAYFDPSQSPFKALVRRLDEIAGQSGAPA